MSKTSSVEAANIEGFPWTSVEFGRSGPIMSVITGLFRPWQYFSLFKDLQKKVAHSSRQAKQCELRLGRTLTTSNSFASIKHETVGEKQLFLKTATKRVSSSLLQILSDQQERHRCVTSIWCHNRNTRLSQMCQNATSSLWSSRSTSKYLVTMNVRRVGGHFEQQ